MSPATAATPDPADPPVNTISDETWTVLLKRADRANPSASSLADPEVVAARLAARHRRSQAGSN
jgi:hypothetical protein